MTKRRMILIIATLILVLVLFLLAEFIYIIRNGKPVSAPNIPRTTSVLGTGAPLTYVVMGDSTSIGQGTTYEHSYAYASAQHLSKSHTVHFTNVGISGATAETIVQQQLSKAVSYKPDVVLLAVGANDARHFVGGSTVETSIQKIVDQLKTANPAVHIVVTGAPDMGAVPRFPWPANQIMSLRTRQVNTVFTRLIAKNKLTFAPIADKTGAAFAAHPEYFAQDKFHPNAKGYTLWMPVINTALDQAIAAK